jgi:hypothetical protein
MLTGNIKIGPGEGKMSDTLAFNSARQYFQSHPAIFAAPSPEYPFSQRIDKRIAVWFELWAAEL